MDCGTCGHQNPQDYEFCEECGTGLVPADASSLACASCGEVNASDYRFCQECGAALAAPSVEAVIPGGTTCSACGHGNPGEYAFCEECGEALSEQSAAVAASPAAAEAAGSDSPRDVPPILRDDDQTADRQGLPRRKAVAWGSIAALAIGAVVTAWILLGDGNDSGGTASGAETTRAPATTSAPGTTTPATTSGGSATTRPRTDPDRPDEDYPGQLIDLTVLPEPAQVASCSDLADAAAAYLDLSVQVAEAMQAGASPEQVAADFDELVRLGEALSERSIPFGCDDSEMAAMVATRTGSSWAQNLVPGLTQVDADEMEFEGG